MNLTEYIRARGKEKGKKILLMTHLVLGYPSFASNREVIRQMVEAGVDLIEMQIPFSEPMADGPVILKANQEAIAAGTRVAQCLEFAAGITAAHPIPFLFMTYYNIVFKRGVERFCQEAAEAGIRGLIVPDLPPEEGGEYLAACEKQDLAPIQIFAPTGREERMRLVAGHGRGFVYCVARRGVTGRKTDFGREFDAYMQRCRAATDLPLAVGFGIAGRDDVAFLEGRADIAVIGTRTIRLVEEEGEEAVGPFIRSLQG